MSALNVSLHTSCSSSIQSKAWYLIFYALKFIITIAWSKLPRCRSENFSCARTFWDSEKLLLVSDSAYLFRWCWRCFYLQLRFLCSFAMCCGCIRSHNFSHRRKFYQLAWSKLSSNSTQKAMKIINALAHHTVCIMKIWIELFHICTNPAVPYL